MKIYHVETQQSYGELMVELEEKGCKWRNGEKPTQLDKFKKYPYDIYVYAEYGEISFSGVAYFKKYHRDETLIKYKAKWENNESLPR